MIKLSRGTRLCCFFSAILISAALLLAGCSARTDGRASDDDAFTVVCTAFAPYDWVQHITAGSGAEVRLLTENGTDLHNYQPSAADVAAMTDCDKLIYIGGVSDLWVENTLSDSDRGVNLMKLLGEAVLCETDEGIAEHEHKHEADSVEETDEHIWLSLKNALTLTEKLTDILCEADGAHAALYRENAASYTASLAALEKRYADLAASAENKTLLVADRFPFRYLAEDYGLQSYAAFPGCSAETEAGFDTVLFLAGKIDEYALSHIAVTESTDGAIAKAVLDNAKTRGVEIVTLDSMQSVSRRDIDAGVTYLDVMERNLQALETLLG